MSDYKAPLADMQFVLRELAGLDDYAQWPGCEDVSADLVDAILDEAGKFAGEVLAPLNAVGDREGAKFAGDAVTTAPGWRAAYTQFREAGWTGLACSPDYGGQGLPMLLYTVVSEIWKSANMAFALCPMLTNGAINALMARGSDALKDRYLPKMVSGEWTGTMNLTEPQAGSDLAAVRTRAEPQADGSYRITGQKIFITYGEHDLTDNIIHLVLARLPNAPEGVKGISLFAVPKFLVNDDGTPGARNDLRCVSLEHKLGIHASPTCVMAYGDNGGATGYLIGEANRGLEIMFIMMNEARFAVGLEGLALAERATQHAVAYARDRVQGFDVAEKNGARVPIIRHPDVRRMLMLMRCQTEAMRALACVVAAAHDRAHHHADAAERERSQAFVDLMIPVVKGWCTETGIDVASLGVQVHGGMGYIEETGAAQYLRDARITTIYEGTTAIQANDLIGRKIARDGGAAARAVIADIGNVVAELLASDDAHCRAIAPLLASGADAMERGTAFICAQWAQDIRVAHAAAFPLLRLFGIVCGGWQMARAALAAQRLLKAGEGDAGFLNAKLVTARAYADQLLSQAPALGHAATSGAASSLQLPEESF
ncbi:acyl-CoA dehydrogenase [Uliginosibacterium sp. H1]|uniref:acyl-CoA dehydrogenase n=1 Tax=Uliginosibacterium sp. H1 TaxID=3114757 RepID=UPI002E19829E|nr:acyl-CoA dehydrogenase [Uliginosibacterium sp. H1]